MDMSSAAFDLFPYILPSLSGLITCISLVILVVRTGGKDSKMRIFGIICLVIALWSLFSASVDLFGRQSLFSRIIQFFHPVSLILIPLTIHLAHHVVRVRCPAWLVPLLYAMTAFVIAAFGLGEKGIFHIRSIAPALVLAGSAYTLKCAVSCLRSAAGKTMLVHALQIFSGIFVLQVLLCLSFLEFSSMNSFEFAFIPVVIMAFGIFTPGITMDKEGPSFRTNLLYILAVAFVLLFLISDTIFIFYHLDHLRRMDFSSWTSTSGVFTGASLVFSILLAMIAYQRSGGRLDALLYTLLCLGLAILALRDIISNALSVGSARQIIFINDMFLVNMIGITGHLTYVIMEKASSKKVLLFYVLGLVLTGFVFTESIFGKVVIPSVPILEKGMVHVLFILIFLAVLVHCAVLVAGKTALAADTSRKRQLLAYLAGMVLIILIGAGSVASNVGLSRYPFHTFAFIAFVFIGYAVFYHDIARINKYTRIRLFISIWRTLLVLIYLACACGIFCLLRDYPLEYIMFRIIPYGIPPMLSFIGAAFLSLFVLGIEQNRIETLLFSLMCFCYALLNLDITLVGIVTDIELALFISRLDHFFLALILLGVNLHLIYAVTGQHNRWWIVYGGYAIGAAIAPFTFTRYYFQGMYSYYWGFFAKKAIAYDVISTLWLIGLVYAMYLLYMAFIRKDASSRTMERNVLWAFALIAALSLTNTPAIYGYEIYPFGTFIFIGLFFFAYGLFRFNLKTALQYVRQTVFWTGLIAMLFMVGIAPGILFSPENHIASLFAGIIAAAVLYSPIRNGWDSIVSLFIRRTADVLNERYHALSDDLSRVRHLEKIHEMIGSWFFKVMGTSSFIAVFRAGETGRYYGWKAYNSKGRTGLFGKVLQRQTADIPLKLEHDHWLMELLRKKQAILTYGSIEMERTRGKDPVAEAEMLKDAEIVVPAFSKGKLLAVFALGRKADGVAYSSYETDLLENFSLMISPYIENAILMQGLEDEVEKRTRELNNALVESMKKEKQISERNKIITRQNQIFRTLLEMSTSIHEMDSLDDLFDFTLTRLKTLFSDFRGGIILEGKRHNILEASAFAGIEEQEQKVILENRHEIMRPDIDRILREKMEKAGLSVSVQDFRTVWNVFPMISRGNKITGYMVFKGQEIDKQTKEIFAVFLGQLSAVTQNKLLMVQLEKMASTDGLTGLYNRSFLNRELNKVIDHAKRYRSICFTVMMIDMNGLKSINDTYGHEKGDDAINCIASMLKRICRRSDIVSRLGGDEFSVLMPSTNNVQAEILSLRIEQEAAGLEIQCTSSQGEKLRIPVCISIGMASSDEVPPDEVMKTADTRMYFDKERFYSKRKGESPRSPSLRS